MKDVINIWKRLSGNSYSIVSQKSDAQREENKELHDPVVYARSLRRKSSVVVNQFFNNAIPLHADGRTKWATSIFVLMTMGLMGLVFGCLILVFQPYEYIFKWKATFGEGGEIYEIWRSPPVDLYLKVYLFNVTNHEAYMKREESKLKFQQIGPYVYRELMEHGNVTFNSNGTVTAVPLHPLKFIPELSNGTEEDMVFMPNIALLSIANVMKDSSYLTRWGLNLLIRQTETKPLVRMTAKEFMFGYESTLVTVGNNLMPSWIKFDRLGLIDRMYDFEGDFETVYTGESDPRLTGLLEKYKGSENLPQWQGKCAYVKGSSDGAKFPSYIEPNDTLVFFRKSLCRSATIVRTGEKYVKGLYSYKYNFRDNELDNGLYNPDNKCFCRQGKCLPYGLLDVTDCYYGFPIALSYPHFYETDPSLLQAVEGLNPDRQVHESYFYIQPKSGIPVDLAFRFQINMALQDISPIEHVDGFSNLVLPLLWFEIGMHELPDNLNNKFILYLNILPVMQEVAVYALFLLGSISLVWSVVKILTYRPKESGSAGLTKTWLDADVQRKRLDYLNEKRPPFKSKEMDVYLNALLSTKEEDVEPIESSALEELPNLKEDIV